MGKILCEKCKRKCHGDVLKVENNYFHKGCFTCTKCDKNLEKGGFFIKDDCFYCQEDYQRYFVAKCKICLKELVGEIVNVMNFSFHRDCFKCSDCSINFNPGDRVTVWHEKFYCPACMVQESVTVSSLVKGPLKTNGIPFSPTSATEDEGCISAADANSSDIISPNLSKNEQSSRVPKCIQSNGMPHKSKPILRNFRNVPNQLPIASNEHAYLSNDSGIEGQLNESKLSTEQTSTPLTSNQLNGLSKHMTSPPLTRQSHQNFFGRVPNSNYGQMLNHSYMSLGDSRIASSVDRYKRNVSFSALNSSNKPQRHFHIPETKNRFLPSGSNLASILFGRSSNTMLSHVINARTRRAPATIERNSNLITHSAMELNQKQGIVTNIAVNGLSNDLPRETTQSGTVYHNDQESTVDVKKMACYPSGQQREASVQPAIERSDWPGPPASAVILAELMRERRNKKRDTSRLEDYPEDAESQDALSIDFSSEAGQFQSELDQYPGIGQAISREQAEQKRRSRSSQNIDPVSASRTPNAAVEPSFKPRFATHQFACQSIRPGYTGGRLSSAFKASSLPASSRLFEYGGARTATVADPGGSHFRQVEFSPHEQPCAQATPTSSSAVTEHVSRPPNQNGFDRYRNHETGYGVATDSVTTSPNGLSPGLENRSLDVSCLVGQRLSYPGVLYDSNPSSLFQKVAPPPPKIIPYNELKFLHGKTVKGVDRTALETHLSDEEFQSVFRLSRTAFYRLPEWKRNDLKRRVELF